MALGPRAALTPVASTDYDHLLDVVLARDVILGCMKHYGVLHKSATPTSSDFIVVQVSENSVTRPGTLSIDVPPKLEQVPPLAQLLSEGYSLIRRSDSR